VTALILGGLFVLYFQIPHLIFKFGAERFVDLGRPRDLSRVEEFFLAALPSALLHVLTIATLGLFKRPAAPINWDVLASVIQKENEQHALSAWIAAGDFSGELSYLWILALCSLAAGAAYGLGEKLRAKGFTTIFRAPAHDPSGSFRSVIRSAVPFFALLALTPVVIIWRVFNIVYADSNVPAYRWTVSPTYAFVMLRDSRLFWGRIHTYEKNRAGEIESLHLRAPVFRLPNAPLKLCVERGEDLIHRLDGMLIIKWSEITDMNIAPPIKMKEYLERIEATIAEAASAQQAPSSPAK
jgi:hypothetical protein